jgi:phospholipid/cholesterol/gamma-HCH transport system substrate-binding protein
MENKSHAFAAGLFAILLGLAVALTVFWLGGEHEAMRECVLVTTDSVSGLNPQAQVRYRGIRVGKVADIHLDPENSDNILITILIHKDVPLTKGTVAKLSYQGITGLAHILLLDDGKDKTPLANSDPVRIAMVPSLIEELGDAGGDLLRETHALMVRANAVLDDENQRHLKGTLKNLEQTTGSLKPTLDNLNATLVRINAVLTDESVAGLARAGKEAGPLLSDARALVGKLQSSADKLDTAIGDASANGASALMPRLNELAGDFSQTSRQLSRLLRILEDSPQGMVLGVPAQPPGPGEPGFSATGGK